MIIHGCRVDKSNEPTQAFWVILPVFISPHQWVSGSCFWNLLPLPPNIIQDRISYSDSRRAEVGSRVLAPPSLSLHWRLGSTPGPHWTHSDTPAPCLTAPNPVPHPSRDHWVLKTESLMSTCGTSNLGHRLNHKSDNMVRGKRPAKCKDTAAAKLTCLH